MEKGTNETQETLREARRNRLREKRRAKRNWQLEFKLPKEKRPSQPQRIVAGDLQTHGRLPETPQKSQPGTFHKPEWSSSSQRKRELSNC